MKSLSSKSGVFCTLLALTLITQQASAASKVSTMATKPQQETTTKEFALSVDPLWLLLGGVGAKFEYFVSPKISIGIGGILIPEQEVKPTDDGKETASTGGNYRRAYNEISLGSNVMLTGSLTSDGLYLNPGIGYQSAKISQFGESKLSGSLSAPFARLTVGYQWMMKTGFRIAAGAGLRVSESRDIVIKDNAGNEVLREKSSNLGGLTLDFNIGYLF